MASQSSPTQQDIQNLAWTMLGEANPGDTAGMSAVGHTVLNRLNSGGYSGRNSNTITNVVKADNAYAAWGIGSQATSQGNHPDTRFPVGSPQFQQAYGLAQQLLNGAVPDNTGGAVSYRQTTPGTQWADGSPGTVSVGGNTFQTTHPVPPANVPQGSDSNALAYTGINGSPALSAISGALVPTDSQHQGVPLAPSQPFNIPGFNPFTSGDALAFDPAKLNGGSSPQPMTADPMSAYLALGAHPATVGDSAALLRGLLDTTRPSQQPQIYDNLPNGAIDTPSPLTPGTIPSYFDTGQGIAGTAQLPAGWHPSAAAMPPAVDNTGLPIGGSAGNSDSWAALSNSFLNSVGGSGSSSVDLGTGYYADGSINNSKDQSQLPAGQPLSFDPTYTTQPGNGAPATILSQQLNPAYTAWMQNQPATSSGMSVSGGATGAVGINGLASGALAMPPPKYIQAPVANPDYVAPHRLLVSPASPAPAAAAPAPTSTLVQQLQAYGMSPSQAYDAANGNPVLTINSGNYGSSANNNASAAAQMTSGSLGSH
jgi:hypothetical protein